MLTIDASVWVAADVADEAARDVAFALLRTVISGRLTVHQPSLWLVEVVAAIARRTGDASTARAAAERILAFPELIVHPLDLEAAGDASAVAAHASLPAADAAYAATARRHGTQLVTLDQQLLERASGLVETFTPAGWLARPG